MAEHVCLFCGAVRPASWPFGLRCADGTTNHAWLRNRTGEEACPHEWERTETGPEDRNGGTSVYAVCSSCGESHYVGRGSGVL